MSDPELLLHVKNLSTAALQALLTDNFFILHEVFYLYPRGVQIYALCKRDL